MRFMLSTLFLSLATLIYSQDWEDMFGKGHLNDFHQLNGEADYLLENGVLIGTAKMGTPNSFMATKKLYGDFILEFDVKIENGMNSGVQIRSISNPEIKKGRVHGYQVEIETSARKWAGGLYDEARRGWLYPLCRNPKGQEAFVTGDWNHYRIEAVGKHINTWVNGIQATRLVDDLTAEGLIGFQVHSIGNVREEGKQVKWKNVRILTKDAAKYMMSNDPEVPEISYLNNTLTEHEKRTGWRLLFNGENVDNWRGAKLDHFPQNGWEVTSDGISVLAGNGGESENGGDIVTKKEFSNFELIVDFKMTEGANSGVKYFVDPELNKGAGSAIGLEFQILDDKKHPDAKEGKNGNRTIGSLYDLIRAENLSEPNRINKRSNGPGSWNRARILVKGGKVEHWLNNVKVVEFDRHSQLFKALVEKSKYEKWEHFGRIPSGHILLQDHGDKVDFRNVKIREF